MAWANPRTWVVGELVTAAFMNQDVRDNISYLQTWSQNDVTGARDIVATVFRNTTDFFMVVTVNVRLQVDDDGAGDLDGVAEVAFHVGAATPPVDQVANLELNFNNVQGAFPATAYVRSEQTVSFVVIPLYYYKATRANAGSGVAPTLLDWFEWGTA